MTHTTKEIPSGRDYVAVPCAVDMWEHRTLPLLLWYGKGNGWWFYLRRSNHIGRLGRIGPFTTLDHCLRQVQVHLAEGRFKDCA